LLGCRHGCLRCSTAARDIRVWQRIKSQVNVEVKIEGRSPIMFGGKCSLRFAEMMRERRKR
jgi:hypothetical protein